MNVVQDMLYLCKVQDFVLKSISNVASTLKNICDAPNIAGTSLKTRLQTEANVMKDLRDQALMQIVLEHLMKAELVGPGAFIECARFILEGLGAIMLEKPFTIDHSNTSVPECVSYNPDVSSIVSFLDESLSVSAKTAVLEALNLAGMVGKIVLKKTDAGQMSVELIQGYTFSTTAPTIVGNIEFVMPKVAVVDGFVESVSEINSLLTRAAETKIPLLFFARGFADDVLTTLSLNTARETFSVIPIIVKYDLEGINTVNDIATVADASLVSSLRGDLINSLNLDDLKAVSSAIVTTASSTLIEHSTSRNVIAHVSMLKNKLNESSPVDVSELIYKRIRSLTPTIVQINIPNGFNHVSETQAIDSVIRTIRSMIEHGITNDGKNHATMLAAQMFSKKCLQLLNDVGFILEA